MPNDDNALARAVEKHFLRNFSTKACRICLKPEEKCVCPICPVCYSVAEFKCYAEHGLISHEVAVARQEWLLDSERMQVEIEEQSLEDIKSDPEYVYPYMKHKGK